MNDESAAGSAQEGLELDPGQLSETTGWDSPVDLGKDAAVIPELAETEVPEELRLEIEGYMERYPDHHSATLPALAAAQRLHGWCSPDALRQVGAVMRVTPAYLSSVASFYDMLNTKPVGRHYVYVCTSVACQPKNASGSTTSWPRPARTSTTGTSASSSAWAPARWRRWRASTAATWDRSRARTCRHRRRAANGEQPLPGRGLTDEGFKLPWEDGA